MYNSYQFRFPVLTKGQKSFWMKQEILKILNAYIENRWKYKEIINWTKYASACRHWKYLYYAVLIHTYMNERVENSIHEYLEPQLLNEET